MNSIRVRYAPSPTGHLHLGSLRTAIYNWLFARHTRGAFLVRIEDTDPERSKEEYTRSILDTLKWASIEPDEPYVIQSQRIENHRQVAQKLLDEGKVYRCFCTPEELKQRLGESASEEGSYTRYDGKCRDKQITDEDLKKPFALRFKIPFDKEHIAFNDLIRGHISFEANQLDDFIIVRSDGWPMYNFVVVVDDAWQRITHVLRGEDHISNTPKQILLYEACGYKLPEFAHFSLILGPDGQRFSKRHGATSVLEYKHSGFLAHALCNYLVRLGWSHGDQELFTQEELIRFFTLEHMSKKSAIFDRKKLEWVNSMYLRNLSVADIIHFIQRDIDPHFKTYFSNWSSTTLDSIIDLYKERVKTLKELIDELRSLHERPQKFDVDITAFKKPEVVMYLTTVRDALDKNEDYSHDAVDTLIKNICHQFSVPLPQIAQPLRVALTGKSSSPGVAQLIASLGGEESSHRIGYFIEYLERSMKH